MITHGVPARAATLIIALSAFAAAGVLKVLFTVWGVVL